MSRISLVFREQQCISGASEMAGFLSVLAASRALLVSWSICEDFLFCMVLTGEHPDATSRCHCTRDAYMCISARNTTLLSSPSQGQRNANELFYYVTRVIALENRHSQVTRDALDLIVYSWIHIDSNIFFFSFLLILSFTFFYYRYTRC